MITKKINIQFLCKKIAFVIFWVVNVSFLFGQDAEKKFTYGLTINGGGTSTSSIGESVSASIGLGVFTKITIGEKLFQLIRFDYNIKQEKFNDITHYKLVDGVMEVSLVDVYKNYGILNLNYSLNYFLINNEKYKLYSSVGIGMSDLFWLKTRVDIPQNENEIANGKTQIFYTNPLTRPSFNTGVGILLPYEDDKQISFQPEINYDYRLPFAKNTYPNFLTYSLRILVFL